MKFSKTYILIRIAYGLEDLFLIIKLKIQKPSLQTCYWINKDNGNFQQIMKESDTCLTIKLPQPLSPNICDNQIIFLIL